MAAGQTSPASWLEAAAKAAAAGTRTVVMETARNSRRESLFMGTSRNAKSVSSPFPNNQNGSVRDYARAAFAMLVTCN